MSRVANLLRLPKKHLNEWNLPEGESRPIGHTLLKFDEEANEFAAVILQDTYGVNTHVNYETISQPNFGTVDNPHVIFTADVPFRYVGCSGQPSEDDLEGHEMMWFLLREGPLQRCQVCGQVYKLVRLRNEFSALNDYYQNQMMLHDFQQVGEADHWTQQNPFRIMAFTFEHSRFEVHSNWEVSLKNPDDFDRLLVDPAYRMEQFELAEHKGQVIDDAYEKLNKLADERASTRQRFEMNKIVYENLVTADAALTELNKHFKRMTKYYSRFYLDPINHERREARMLERSKQRVEKSHTIYLQDFSEEELQYRDYFETDLEVDKSLERDPAGSLAAAKAQPELKAKKFIFTEEYTKAPEGDMTSFIERKVFRFKYRVAFSEMNDHLRREKRMLESKSKRGYKELDKFAKTIDTNVLTYKSSKDSILANKEYLQALAKEAILDYKSYFESDLEEDFELIDKLPPAETLEFANAYENPMLEKISSLYPKTHISIEKGKNEYEGGLFLSDSTKFFEKFDKEVAKGLAEQMGMAIDEKDLGPLEKLSAEADKELKDSAEQLGQKLLQNQQEKGDVKKIGNDAKVAKEDSKKQKKGSEKKK